MNSLSPSHQKPLHLFKTKYMLKKIAVLACFISMCFSGISFSQLKFQQHVNAAGSVGIGEIQITSDNGYILSGTRILSNHYTAILIKTDSLGNTIWSKGIDDGASGSVKQTSDGGYIMTADRKFRLIKSDANGNVLWEKNSAYGNAVTATCLDVTTDNGFIIAGNIHLASNFDTYLVKTDSAGNIAWTSIFPGGSPHSVFQTLDGGYAVCGLGSTGGYISKADAGGQFVWNKSYNSNNGLYSYSMQQTHDGGFIISGKNAGSGTSILLIKTDSAGAVQWSRRYYSDGGGDNLAYDAIETEDHGFAVATGVSISSTEYGSCLLKTDSLGIIEWAMHYGGNGGSGRHLLQTADNGFMFCESSSTFSQSSIGLIKTDSVGSSGCFEEPVTIYGVAFNIFATDLFSADSSGGTLFDTTSVISTAQMSFSTLCSTVGIPENSTENSFTVFPNPSDGNFKINFDRLIEKVVIELTDLSGKKIYKAEIHNQSEKEISVASGISRGFYFLRISDGDNTICKKIIVNK